MWTTNSVLVSQSLLGLAQMRMMTYHESRIPQSAQSVVVVSNHRSFMDAAILIQALEKPIRIACHHYMGQTPVLRELVELLGCFPFAETSQRQKLFFEKAEGFLQSQQWVGLFPEGGTPMVELTHPNKVGDFQRGFAHLAFRVQVPNLVVLPVAIASLEESVASVFPTRLLSLFDPTEPLFDRPGLHPMVIYHHVKVLIGRPYWITPQQRHAYHGKKAKLMATELTEYCRGEITSLLTDS